MTSMVLKNTLMVLSLLLLPLLAQAVVETYEFNSEVDRKRYNQFIDELRCPKCQNQNLAGSNSPIAADLRRELHRMIDTGKSDQEIVNFMVDRYGEFVLYRPPVDKHTLVLWGGPVVLGLLGLIGVLLVARRYRQNNQEVSPLSAAEQERLDALLGTKKPE